MKITFTQAIDLSIKKWTHLSKHTYIDDIEAYEDLYNNLPGLEKLTHGCGLCEKYLINKSDIAIFDNCKHCPLVKYTDIYCAQTGSLYIKWSEKPIPYYAKNMLCMLREIKKVGIRKIDKLKKYE